MSAAAWMDTHSVAEINRENGYRVRFPASGSQTDEQQSLASRYQARPALANTSEEDMKRDISLTATYHREGDPATEQPRATIHVGRDDISISMDLGLISIDIEDWPAVQAEIESLLAVRGHFLEGEAA